MRRRVMIDTAPAKGTADRYMPETPSGNTSKSASYYFLVASSMLVAVCVLVLICASTGIEVIKNTATTRDESTKDLASLAKPKLRESKLDLNQTIGAASKQRVALPNLLLIEAGTFAVTDWLYEAGACHAKVFVGEPAYYDKQVQFFDQDARYKQGIKFYKKRFEHCLDEGQSSIIFDATPNTIEFPQRVFDVYSQASMDAKSRLKVIFVLREPVEREFLRYKMKANDYNQSNDKKNGWFTDAVSKDGSLMSFEQYSSSVLRLYIKDKAKSYTTGLYAMLLKEWAKLFDRGQLLILNYDEIRDSPHRAQWRIQKFIGTDFALNLAEKDDAISTEGISETAIKVLEPLFRKSNEELYDFLSHNSTGPWMEQSPFPHFTQKAL